MKTFSKYIFSFFTVLILILDIWFSFGLEGNLNYINGLKNVDLIQKTVWINYNVAIWILAINAVYILVLTINKNFVPLKKKVIE
ncbi:hypothetical protein [Chryseobacterium sp. ERMR1:04]|uniref:hypothetical protein n=1 Tax=Chryseobacterium sp. ERMR1:04 TaxID=1705393 RepID=UPI0006C8B2C5|nr:hypothetical protein [Chryseobacterium sp. ERMR1:04]KPH11247.1 hypothetical protein AMQ68_17610 [Chryseobacterium sp. ERMR1:04]